MDGSFEITRYTILGTEYYVTRPWKPGISEHQLDSTFCLYVKATLMHYPETPST